MTHSPPFGCRIASWAGGLTARETVGNLRRVTVEGAATSNEWLRVTVAPNASTGEALGWERVPYSS